MNSREDKMLERILARQKSNKIATLPRASTLQMVRVETVRRCKDDKASRVIYMGTGGELGIRLVIEKKSGDQTSLYHVNGAGRITEFDLKGRK